MTTPKRFKIGDRVRIVGSHPWRRHQGTIVEPMNAAGFDWSVELDEECGHRAGCAERDLRASTS